MPPERQFEALYTLEFQTPVSETEVVDWLDAVTRELLRRRGAWVTTSMRYDNGLRTFWFHTPTTVGWGSIVARKRREDGSMPFIAAAVETPRQDLRPRARR